MYLNRTDIVRIQGILNKFPEVDRFEINEEPGGGIGTTVTMSFNHTVNGESVKITIELIGPADW